MTDPSMEAPADLRLPCSDLETTTSSISSWLASVSATDACDPDIIVSNNYTAFNIDLCTPSMTTVTWTATDDCGNTTTVMADLIIEGDEVPPVFSFTPAPLTIDCNSGDITLGNWLNSAIATDACDPDITITNDYTPTAIDICNGGGTTTITWTATDACGNTETTMSTITVTPDTTPPVITPPGPLTIDCSVIGNGDPSFLVDSLLANVSATDACDPDIIVTSSFDSGLIDLCAAEPYDITVTFNATDACGNAAISQTTTITIIPDNTPPVAVCCMDFSTSLISGVTTIDIADIDCGSLDNCTSSDDLTRSMFRMVNGVVDRGVNGEFFTLTEDELGTNEIFLVVEDFCGNADTCSVQVTVTSDPSIGLAKRVSRVIPSSDGSNVVQYEFNIENFGDVNLENIQVVDNLSNIFNPCGIVDVLSITSDDFTVNSGFNGSSNTDLLVGDDNLPVGDRGSILLEVLVDNCNGEEGPFDNTATVSGDTPDGNTIIDISQNGSDPDPDNDGPENDDEVTPVQFEFFSFIGAAKSVNGLEVFQDGSARITYRFTIENFGNLVLDSITLKDNFTGVFDPCMIAEVVPGSLTSSFFEVNENFDGFSDVELLAMTVDNSLDPGEIGTVFVTVLIDDCGNDPDPFFNQAQVVAQDASGTIIRDDLSNIGNDPDPDGDNDPTNNDIRTPVDIGFNPSIGLAKRVVSGPTLRDDGCFDVVYELNVENTGDLAIANIQVSDNLTTTFANADSFYVVGITSEEFDVNVNYDGGVTDAALLTGFDTLNVEFSEGEEGSILLEVVVCSEMDMTFNNQATALGTALNNESLTDLSTDGSDPDPERDGSDNNSVPTPITLGTNPSLELDKRISEGPIENADGTFDLTYEIRVENTGDIPLVIDSLLDSLDVTFADAAAWEIIRLESEHFDINDNYDGAGDYNLINGPETINVGDAGAVFLGVRVAPTETATSYLNVASVTGESIIGGSLEGVGLSDVANVPVNLVCQNTIICPAFPDTIIQSNDQGWCLAVVNFPFAEADLCQETTDVQFEYLLEGVGVDGLPNNVWLPGQPSGLSYNVGVTDVTMRYQFSLNGEPGVSDSCEMVIYVVDKEAPLLTASIPVDVTLDCCTPLDTFELSQTQVTDNCAGFGEIMITRDIISNRSDDPADCEYYEYVDTIRWTISDGMVSPNEGEPNLSIFAQVVTHIDTMAPTIILPPDLIVTECLPDTTFNVVDFEEIVVDTVTRRLLLDGVWVEVEEIVKETIPVIDTIVNGNTYGQALAFDKCSPDSVIMAQLSYMDSIVVECKGEKEATIFRIWSVSDPCGNSTRAIQEISIIDRNPPEIVCRDSITISLDASGQYILTNEDLLLSIRSACYDDSELAEVTIEPNVFNCNDIGVQRVLITATDLCGGSSSFCEVFVDVVDTFAPVLNCPDAPIVISELPTDCAIDLPELRRIMSSADCDVTFTTDPPLFADGLPLGVQEVTVTATDASGNSSSCIIAVDIQAALDIPETMTCLSRINLSLDQNCEARIRPEMLFLGPDGICPNFLCVSVQDEEGNDHANFFDTSDDGQEFTVTINDCNGSNNSCWGTVRIELKTSPDIVFPADTTLLCVEPTDPDNPRLGYPIATNCVDGWTFDFRDTHINFDRCDIPRARVERVWTITDRQGDIQTDTQIIDILPFNTEHLLFPADITIEEPLECGEVEETLDEIENAVLSATSRIHPDSTGSPNLFGIPLKTNGGLCLFALGYEDRVLEICEGSFQILREWEVSDVCSPFERDVNPISHTQVITVFDTRQPRLLSGPDTIFMSIDLHTCTFNGPIPYVLAEEECSFATFDAYVSGGGFITFDGEVNTPEFDVQGNRIPVGSHQVTNVFKDACGNVAIYDYTLVIQDWIAPTVITEDTVSLSLTPRQGDNNNLTKVRIESIDAGSNDNNCSEIERCLLLEEEFDSPIMRNGVHLQDDLGRLMYTTAQDFSVEVFDYTFSDGVTTMTESIPYTYCRSELAFDCMDLGPHGVVLLVSDSSGNVNSGHTTVVIEDKGVTRLICNDVTIDCGEDFSVEAIGIPEMIGSSCGETTLHHIDIEEFVSCGVGQIEREWYIDSVFACSQMITIEGTGAEAFDPLTIKWPVHADGSVQSGIARACDNNTISISSTDVNMADELSCNGMVSTAPIWCDTDCSLVEASFADQSFDASDGCRKIIRTWTVIDWCTFQSNEGADNDFDTGDDLLIAVDDSALGQGNWDASLQDGDSCETCKNDADNSTSTYFRFTNVDLDGFYHFDQIITITDDTAPEIAVDREVTFDIIDGADSKEDTTECTASGSVTATATDLCGNNSIDPNDLTWTAEIVDQAGNQLDDVTGSGNSLIVSLPESGSDVEYTITWYVTDGCSNTTQTTTSVNFTDTKSPTPVCIESISTATITGSGEAVIWAADFDQGSFDNCSEVTVGFLDDNDVLHPNLIVSCADLDGAIDTTISLDLYVEDASGNRDFCSVNLRVDNNQDNCTGDESAATTTATGVVYNESEQMIENAQVTLNGIERVVTDVTGSYTFENIREDRNHFITASLTDNPLNGITAIDIVLMQRHILGLQELDSPYKLFASDLNIDERISAVDQVELRRAILGLQDKLGDVDSWKFIPKEVAPSSQADLYPVQDTLFISRYQSNEIDFNLIGVKMGDVNGDAIPNSSLGQIRQTESLLIESAFDEVRAGEEVVIDFTSQKELLALQLTLDISNYELVELRSGRFKITTEDYAVHDNYISIIWTEDYIQDGHTYEEWEVLYSLVLKSKIDQSISETLSINSDITESLAYTSLEERLELNGEHRERADEDLILYQNTPNPFRGDTQIKFYNPKADEVEVTIFDALGRLVYKSSQQYLRGEHTILIQREDLDGASGVLTYRLESTEDSQVGHMIAIQ